MRRTRFSLYCLDDGDEYFGDSIAEIYVVQNSKGTGASRKLPSGPPSRAAAVKIADNVAPSILSSRTKIRGKLRLAGRSLLFDPDESRFPIYTFKFVDLVKEEDSDLLLLSEGELISSSPGGGSSGGSFIKFRCSTVYTQAVGGEQQPWGVDNLTAANNTHIFGFPFQKSAASFLDQVNMLLSVSRVAERGPEKERILARLIAAKERENPFPISQLKDASELIKEQMSCARIAPLTQQRGRLVVSTHTVYFQPTFPITAPGIESISLGDVRRVERRRIHFRDVGLELATFDDRVELFAFPTREDRERVFDTLGSSSCIDRLSVNSLSNMTKQWQLGSISTFDYLMYLNWAAGRSTNDLAQYPVLPWVIADNVSDELDLEDPRIYRNLSRPIGALTEMRLKNFRERAANLKEFGQDAYLYGSHYSNPAYVTYFLVRQRPEFMLVLHKGKLDHGSRMFDSIPDAFSSVMAGPTDLKELTPEFFYGKGDFLRRSRVDLGTKSDGSSVRRDVQLPAWAGEYPSKFIKMNRDALEGEHVSANIHHWIDLIFGYKQQGEEAWKADNVFHPYSYESCIASLENMKDDVQRSAIEAHIREFGQTPKQLFTSPHPQRTIQKTPSRSIRLDRFMPPDSDNLEEVEDGAMRSPTTASLRRSFGNSGSPLEPAKPAGGEKPVHVDPSGSIGTPTEPRSGVIFAGECESDSDDDGGGSPLPENAEENPEDGSSDVSSTAGVADIDFNDLQERRPDSEQSSTVNSRQLPDAADEPSSGGAPAGASRPAAQGNAALHFVASARASTKPLSSIAVSFVTENASWVLDHHDLPRLPIAVCGDSTGGATFVDLVTHKKMRTIVDLLGRAPLLSLINYASPVLEDGGDESLVVGSAAGTVYALGVEHCCINEELEVTSSYLSGVAARGKIAVTASKDGTCSIWKMNRRTGALSGGDPIHVFDVFERPVAMDIHPDEKVVAVLNAAGSGVFVDLGDDNEELPFELPPESLVASNSTTSSGRNAAGRSSAASSSPILMAHYTKDGMLIVVTWSHLVTITAEGEVWGCHELPFTASFAGTASGGAMPSNALLICSLDGDVALLARNSGKVLTTSSIPAGEMQGGSIVCGSVGSEHIVFGDTNGRIHLMSFLPEM